MSVRIKRAAHFAVAILVLMLALTMAAAPFAAHANSAPAYWPQNGRGEILLGHHAGIGVDSEQLTFDFTPYNDAQQCRVTAAYTMTAPQDAALTLAFPLSSNIFFDRNVSVQLNGADLMPETYWVKDFHAYNAYDLDIAEILQALCLEPYEFGQAFDGTLHRVVSSEPIRFSAPDPDLCVVAGAQHVQVKRADEAYQITAVPRFPNEALWILTMGFTPDFGDAVEVTAQDSSFNQLMLDYLTARGLKDMYNYMTHFVKDNAYYECDLDAMIRSAYYNEQLTVMLFDAPFTKGENRLTVSYDASGNYQSGYKSPVYRYRYMTNPAKEWAYFNRIVIDIKTNAYSAFVLNASLDFEATSDGYRYEGGLPGRNLDFQVCAQASPGKYYNGINFLWVFVVIMLAVIIFLPIAGLIVVLLLVGKQRQKKKQKEYDEELRRVRELRERREALHTAQDGKADRQDCAPDGKIVRSQDRGASLAGKEGKDDSSDGK